MATNAPDLSSQRLLSRRHNMQGDFMGMRPVKPQHIHGTRGVIRKRLEFAIGLLEDAPSIQLAVSNVLQALAIGRLETRRASVLLYGLQLAANNARLLEAGPIESGLYESGPKESRL